MSELVIIQIRGLVRVRQDIIDTLQHLNLQTKHTAVIVKDTPIIRGMIRKVESYVTYGELDETGKTALKKRKAMHGKQIYHLNPPRGGFERKGIKKNYKEGGALGNRGKEINKLLARMA